MVSRTANLLTTGRTPTTPVWSIDLDDAVSTVTAAPRGPLVAAASLSGRTVVIDTDKGIIVTEMPHHELGALAAAWSPDGRRLAVGGADGTVVSFPTADVFDPLARHVWRCRLVSASSDVRSSAGLSVPRSSAGRRLQ